MMFSRGPLERRQTMPRRQKDTSHRFLDFQVAEA